MQLVDNSDLHRPATLQYQRQDRRSDILGNQLAGFLELIAEARGQAVARRSLANQ